MASWVRLSADLVTRLWLPTERCSINKRRKPSPDKFYKRKSQEKHFALRRKFSDFPAPVNERGWFWSSAPSARFVAQASAAVWTFSVSGFHRVVATKPIRSETNKQP